jgi:hypothetical protein
MEEKPKNALLPYKADSKAESATEGYPSYPVREDIYNRSREEKEIDPENVSKTKFVLEKKIKSNEKDFSEDFSGEDLDVPGAELDDNQEIIGNEDEENNYYSLGGDEHSNLDEEKDET